MGKLEVLYSINGNHLAAILLAADEAKRRSITLDGYELTLFHEREQLIASFTDQQRSGASLGNPGIRPGLEVHISPDGPRVISSNFIR